jgi:hypothetical protein
MKSSYLSAKRLMVPAYSVSRKGGKSVLIKHGTLWKYNLNFVKDVPMKYVKLIATVNIVSEEKGGNAFVLTSVVNQTVDIPSNNGGREMI